MAYQSLYRRYRPRRFSEVRGQQHLVRALQNAVREERVGHAYLFSGPRGTGKTTTARILAKVLNCEAPVDGEPCCACASCLAIEAGTSFDVHELDAASNNKVDDIRDLITKAALGTPGRTKVYILDEVHMLTAAASNALLKTLEEPPDHVVFVLATTDPQKVLPTIRSRTQHFEVHLLPAADLRALVTDVIADAGLDVDEAGIEHVLRAGNGSARDTLSALDQVVAAGGVPTDIDAVDRLVEALCDADTGAALLAVESGCNAGANPRVLGEALIARLRDVFLTAMGSELDRLSDRDRERVAEQARRLGPAGATRALEVLGEAFVTIADAPDQRIPLEVALVRLTRPEADTTLAALAQRIDRLEQGSTAGTAPTRPAAAPPATASVPAGGTAERRAAPADDVTEPTTAATGDADAAAQRRRGRRRRRWRPPPTGGGRPAAAARGAGAHPQGWIGSWWHTRAIDAGAPPPQRRKAAPARATPPTRTGRAPGPMVLRRRTQPTTVRRHANPSRRVAPTPAPSSTTTRRPLRGQLRCRRWRDPRT
ncbi:MAG: DNA polymerase III subunit gamma/tau [Acidimicrobiales bacterium]